MHCVGYLPLNDEGSDVLEIGSVGVFPDTGSTRRRQHIFQYLSLFPAGLFFLLGRHFRRLRVVAATAQHLRYIPVVQNRVTLSEFEKIEPVEQS